MTGVQNKFVVAVAYARYSSHMQSSSSIEAQLRAIEEFADKNNIFILERYVDEAQSGTSDDRVAFQQMMRDATYGKFQLVLVHKMDRFARNVDDSRHYRKMLKRLGITVRSVVENLDEDTPQGAMMLNVMDGISEFYSKNLAQETMKGLKERAIAGKHTGGIPPYGYDVDPETKMLVINQHEAAAVRMIFDMYVQGFSYGDIVAELNKQGYRSKRGQPFVVSSIYSILENEKYIGRYVFNKSASKDVDGKRNGHKKKDPSEWICAENGCPAIINEETFALVQKKRQNAMARRKASNVKETYLLKGKIFCGDCGGSYVGGRRSNQRTGHVYAGYKCNKRFNHNSSGCTNKEIRREYIEGAILDRISKCVFSDANAKLVVAEYNKYLKQRDANSNSQLKALRKEQADITRELESLYELVVRSKAKILLDKLETLDQRKQQVDAQIEHLLATMQRYTLTEQDVRQVFAVIRKKIHSGQLNDLYAVMQTFVDKVIMYHDRAEVFLNYFPNITLDFETDVSDIDPGESEKTVRKEKKEHFLNENAPDTGGERGIRTLVRVLA